MGNFEKIYRQFLQILVAKEYENNLTPYESDFILKAIDHNEALGNSGYEVD